MRAVITIIIVFLTFNGFGQIYYVLYDSTLKVICDKKLSYEEVIEKQDFKIVEENRIPGIIIIHVDMMMIFGINGEAFIEDVEEVGNTKVFTTKYKDNQHIFTLKKNKLGVDELLIEFPISDTKKCLSYKPNVFVSSE